MRDNYGYFEEDQLGRFGDARLWRRLLRLGLPFWRGALLAVLLSLLVVACSLSLPYLLKLGVDGAILDQGLAPALRQEKLGRLALAFLALMLLEFAGNFLQVLVLEATGQQIMHRLRQLLFARLLGLDLPFYAENPAGKLVTRLTNDIQNMHEMFTSVVVTLFNDLLKLGGIFAVLFWMEWRLALLLSLLLPVLLLNTVWFSRLARDAFRRIRTQLARINAFLQEALAGLTIIQLFQREQSTAGRFSGLNQAYCEQALVQIRIFGIFLPAIEVLSALAIGAILWYGGGRIMAGAMSLGVLVAFLSYLRLFFQPLRELSQKYSIVQSALASAERIFQLLDSREQLPVAVAPLRPARVRGELVFERVSFGYATDQPVLADFSLLIRPGETLAIVGATGSGKTTLINLLERFYDPDAGRVLLDGVDLRDLAPDWLRRQIGLVMQEVFLLPGTIRENIVLDEPKSDAELLEILARAQLARFLAGLPQGLDTRVGEGGMDLSAGQRQLLAFARVLAREPRILLLDEATSSVDAESEMFIEGVMEASFAGRTNIVIAHRLSTIRRAERILVMQGGRIVEQGTHAQLAASGGPYSCLLAIFSGG